MAMIRERWQTSQIVFIGEVTYVDLVPGGLFRLSDMRSLFSVNRNECSGGSAKFGFIPGRRFVGPLVKILRGLTCTGPRLLYHRPTSVSGLYNAHAVRPPFTVGNPSPKSKTRTRLNNSHAHLACSAVVASGCLADRCYHTAWFRPATTDSCGDGVERGPGGTGRRSGRLAGSEVSRLSAALSTCRTMPLAPLVLGLWAPLAAASLTSHWRLPAESFQLRPAGWLIGSHGFITESSGVHRSLTASSLCMYPQRPRN